LTLEKNDSRSQTSLQFLITIRKFLELLLRILHCADIGVGVLLKCDGYSCARSPEGTSGCGELGTEHNILTATTLAGMSFSMTSAPSQQQTQVGKHTTVTQNILSFVGNKSEVT
jgi:hypothetical protein